MDARVDEMISWLIERGRIQGRIKYSYEPQTANDVFTMVQPTLGLPLDPNEPITQELDLASIFCEEQEIVNREKWLDTKINENVQHIEEVLKELYRRLAEIRMSPELHAASITASPPEFDVHILLGNAANELYETVTRTFDCDTSFVFFFCVLKEAITCRPCAFAYPKDGEKIFTYQLMDNSGNLLSNPSPAVIFEEQGYKKMLSSLKHYQVSIVAFWLSDTSTKAIPPPQPPVVPELAISLPILDLCVPCPGDELLCKDGTPFFDPEFDFGMSTKQTSEAKWAKIEEIYDCYFKDTL
ncbi:MAG: hypothetical protein M1829_001558 [Trizodia sp. TS-e1964]|nr:MAG: hypothetical protein M1829_001558 [Trizodia sp. TS-e1964]